MKFVLAMLLITLLMFVLVLPAPTSSRYNCDVNGDGEINWQDCLLVWRCLLFNKPPMTDVDGNGSVDIIDMLTVYLRISPKEPFPREEFLFLLIKGRLWRDLNDDGLVNYEDSTIADVNRDKRVDLFDLVLVGQEVGIVSDQNKKMDLNQDGWIDKQDMDMVTEWIHDRPVPEASPAPAPATEKTIRFPITSWGREKIQ